MGIKVTEQAEQIPLNIVGSSAFGNYPKVSAEKTYNMFESDGFLVPFPAYHKVLELLTSGGEGRGFFRSFRGNRMIAVVSSNVYDIDVNLGPKLVGTLATASGFVSIDENLEQQIAIVDGLNLYIYNYAIPSGVIPQTGGDLGGALVPNYVCYHNTYFLLGNRNNTGDGSLWYSFQPSSATTVSQHTVMALQTKPDRALAIKRIPGQSANVLVMGGSVCEVHTNVPGLSLTGIQQDYQRNNSLNVDYGVLSVATIASDDTHIAWLGVNENNLPVFMSMEGQTATRISTDGIDFFLQSLKAPERSIGAMYRINGHLFYHLTFLDPRDNTTLIYDYNNQKFYHLSDQALNYHPLSGIAFFDAQDNVVLDGVSQNIFFLSVNNGAIYQLSQEFTHIVEDINDDLAAGVDPNLVFEMQRIRIPKNIRFPTSTSFRVNLLCFTIEMGCDEIPAVQDCLIYMITENNIRMFSEDPSYRQLVPERAGQEDCLATPYQGRIDLAISKDGGVTFSNYVPRWMNPTGIRKNILNWNKMGRVNDFVPKIKFHTLGRIVCTNGYIEVMP